jgi:hypothetical protein
VTQLFGAAALSRWSNRLASRSPAGSSDTVAAGAQPLPLFPVLQLIGSSRGQPADAVTAALRPERDLIARGFLLPAAASVA